ncbi:MAG: bifunctional YncE family protein/alkaline phosphatase family protein [Saprospiraceae bacterium]|nr:bifunctional YncE family protein/alkaline phosphatase family protein [Saprospiraceae bacterium]
MLRLHTLSFFLFIGLFLFIQACSTPQITGSWLIEPPAGDRYCQIDVDGATIIPNGRMVMPMGQTVRIAPHPFGLALSPDGSVAVTANSGNRPFSITILENPASGRPNIRQVPKGALSDKNLLEDVFMGLAVTPDNQRVWVAGGQANKLFLFDLKTGAKLDSIVCAQPTHADGYIGDLVLSRDGNTLYACDQSNFRLIIADTRSRKVLHYVPVGRYPFGVTLSPDEKTVYVANVGMFEYQLIRHADTSLHQQTAIDFSASAFNSKEMRQGYQEGEAVVPGLGDPNAPESFSVWAVDVSATGPKVIHRIKTGFLVGEKIEGIPAVGGSGPNSLVATDQYVFVTNGNNDCISVIEPARGRVVKNIFLKPLLQLNRFRGVIPFGMALSPDKKRLYVAESGLNAIAVVDVPTLEVVGHLPVGWFPSKVAVSPDGKKLYVANAKGYGSGPNGGYTFKEGPEGSYVGHLMHGSVTMLDIPNDKDLPLYTQQVLDHNFKLTPVSDPGLAKRAGNPVPLFPGQKQSPIKYIVFISKENRTYDEVFGQVKQGKGDPEIARYGYNRTFSNRDKSISVEGATIMPNHLALAQRFGIADNFYVDADHSADGHRWLVNTYPNQWVETNVPAGYGGTRDVKTNSKEPGKFGWTGSAGAIFPEDYNEAGSMWEHLERNGISFYNWGFGTEMPSNLADSTMKYFGQKVLVNYPVPAPLFVNTSQRYPTYNMAIPDQFRADLLMEEFREKWLNTTEKMPQMLTILLPNDHGAGERPAAGYPFRESYMADNDLALGRIVEFLSRTPYWKEMAIFVTEDDAQDGRDHVDAHRSLLMVYSPWAKRNFVSHKHYSFGSIFKTFWNILGTPYLNQYDAAAADLSDFFTNQPDFTPYQALPVDTRVLDPQKLLTPFDEKFDWKSVLESPVLDKVDDFIQEKKKGN